MASGRPAARRRLNTPTEGHAECSRPTARVPKAPERRRLKGADGRSQRASSRRGSAASDAARTGDLRPAERPLPGYCGCRQSGDSSEADGQIRSGR